jgi:hypothetical protein
MGRILECTNQLAQQFLFSFASGGKQHSMLGQCNSSTLGLGDKAHSSCICVYPQDIKLRLTSEPSPSLLSLYNIYLSGGALRKVLCFPLSLFTFGWVSPRQGIPPLSRGDPSRVSPTRFTLSSPSFTSLEEYTLLTLGRASIHQHEDRLG